MDKTQRNEVHPVAHYRIAKRYLEIADFVLAVFWNNGLDAYKFICF